jgi:SOS-response transcriptional repressor LexA
MRSPLTKRQKEMLDYINNFIKENVFSPSLEEIRTAFKLKAISTVHEHLENLKKKGYISKDMNQARGIQIKEEKNKLIELKVKFDLKKKSYKTYKGAELKIYFYNPKELDEDAINALVITEEFLGFHKNDIVIFQKTNKARKGEVIIENQNNLYDICEFKNSKNSEIIGKVLQIQRSFN